MITRMPDGRWYTNRDMLAEWKSGAAPIDLIREHDRLMSELGTGNAMASGGRTAAEVATGDERDAHLRRADEGDRLVELAATQLRSCRRAMRALRLNPPPLRGDLARLIDGEDGDHA